MARSSEPVIGIDLGGTNVRAGLVRRGALSGVRSARLPEEASVEAVLERIHEVVRPLAERGEAAALGVGVPSVVKDGVVYDVQNIPSWKEVPLRRILEEAYDRPVFVGNDANCFALGEWTFGKGRQGEEATPPGNAPSTLAGLILGTGFAAGLVLEGRLYAGPRCGAGEIGMLPYRESIFEHYCSGQFFEREYGTSGAALYERAEAGEAEARAAFDAYGRHLGEGVKAALYAYDPDVVVLGGSVRKAYRFFEDAMRERVASFAYSRTLEDLRIEVSERDDIALLGAAALALEARAPATRHAPS